MDDDNDGDENSNNEITCPLFMDGLPSNFTMNPALSAIASLLEEDDEEGGDNSGDSDGVDEEAAAAAAAAAHPGMVAVPSNPRDLNSVEEKKNNNFLVEKQTVVNKINNGGGGKLRKEKSRSSRRNKPYCTTMNNPNRIRRPKKTGVGEAQLFIQMWKI